MRATRGIASVLIDGLPLSEALLTTEAYGENLKLLLVDRAGEWMADQFSLPAAQDLIEDAKDMADVVIIDSPPLTEVIDALPLVQMTDDVVVVVRLGRTHINKLTPPRRAARPVQHQARGLRAGRRQPHRASTATTPSGRCGCRKRPGPPRSAASGFRWRPLRGLPAGVLRARHVGAPLRWRGAPDLPDWAWYRHPARPRRDDRDRRRRSTRSSRSRAPSGSPSWRSCSWTSRSGCACSRSCRSSSCCWSRATARSAS